MNHPENLGKSIFLLVVEDSLTQAKMIEHFLVEHHYTLHMCYDGEEAYAWLKTTPLKPDIIISDIEMPKMDGYTLCKAICDDKELCKIPVILLTSRAEPNNIIKSIEAGASKFLVKPYAKKLLPEVIEELYLNTTRRMLQPTQEGISLRYKGSDFLIAAEKTKLLDLLISSYEDSYYKNVQLEESRSNLEEVNDELEEKIQERTKELMSTEKKYRTLSENIPSLIVRIDRNLNIIYVNKAIEKLFGFSRKELVGNSVTLLNNMVLAYSCIDALNRLFSNGEKIREEFELQTPNGRFWLDSTIVAEYDNKGNITSALKVCNDITSRKASEQELYKLSQAIEQNQNVIIITNIDGTIEYVNQAFETVTGYTKDETIGKITQEHEACKIPQNEYDEGLEQLKEGKSWSGEFNNQHRNGSQYIEASQYSPIFQSDGSIINYIVSKEDISDKKIAQERVHFLANFDALTGLPNRTQLEEKVKTTISYSKRSGENFTVMFLDLDRFKEINDTLGQNVGDLFLIEISKRFQSLLREEDMVSRFGGDEFIFLIQNIEMNKITHMLKRLLESIALPVIIGDNELSVTASIGLSVYPIDGEDSETIFKNADAAMYYAKQEGRNCYRFFTKEMQENSVKNLQLSTALFRALELDQMYVVYQPQISLESNTVIGAEALLRWHHPTLGNIPPDKFIPLAEDNGLILQIGEWVLRTAVTQMQTWIQSGLDPMIIAVNISALQFRHAGLLKTITNTLEKTKLPPQYLELELTEAAAMSNPQIVLDIMNNLHNRGIKIAIDDFGTGYSSLSYLKKFKAYKLKIDQSFISDIGIDLEDRAIVAAIISMSKSLGLKTIAEGVETLVQLNYLRELGCDEIQGYYYSKPIRAEEFEAFVREKKGI